MRLWNTSRRELSKKRHRSRCVCYHTITPPLFPRKSTTKIILSQGVCYHMHDNTPPSEKFPTLFFWFGPKHAGGGAHMHTCTRSENATLEIIDASLGVRALSVPNRDYFFGEFGIRFCWEKIKTRVAVVASFFTPSHAARLRRICFPDGHRHLFC